MLKKLIAAVVGMAVMAMPVYAGTNLEYDYVKETIRDRYIYELPANFGGANTLEALFLGLDPYSKLLSRPELSALQQDLGGATAGIGVYLVQTPAGGIQVAEIVEDSPAQGQLQKGDTITAIDGASTTGVDLSAAALRIRGVSGSRITLTITRPGLAASRQLTLVRAVVPIKTVSTIVLKNGAAIIRILQFGEGTPAELSTALATVKAAGAGYLVLDLRDSPGGLLSAAVDCSRQLIPAGQIVTVKYRDHQESYTSSSGQQPFAAGRVAVLVNGNTASAAEIMAMALRENGDSILVGEKTHGKGAVQRLYNIPSGGFKLTEGEYMGPKGTAINHVGLQPDSTVTRYSPKLQLDAMPPVSLARKLQPGDTGDDVTALQQRLKWLGYPSADPEGAYGQATGQAVAAFQAAQGLYVYGLADYTTQNQLYNAFSQFLAEPRQDLQLLTAIQALGCGT